MMVYFLKLNNITLSVISKKYISINFLNKLIKTKNCVQKKQTLEVVG